MSNGDRICNICGNYINNHVKVCKSVETKSELLVNLKNIKPNSMGLYNVPFVSEVETFNETMGKSNNYKPIIPEKKEWMFVYNFVLEELEEYKKACEEGDIVGVLDGLCDLTYVAVGNLCMLHGLKDKFVDAFMEVQASNMSKACRTEEEAKQTAFYRGQELGIDTHYEKHGDFWIVYRTLDRKVLKNINYFKPNLKQFFTEEELKCGK